MTYKGRKRLALAVLVIGLPVYIVLAVTLMSEASRFPKPAEFIIFRITLQAGTSEFV